MSKFVRKERVTDRGKGLECFDADGVFSPVRATAAVEWRPIVERIEWFERREVGWASRIGTPDEARAFAAELIAAADWADAQDLSEEMKKVKAGNL